MGWQALGQYRPIAEICFYTAWTSLRTPQGCTSSYILPMGARPSLGSSGHTRINVSPTSNLTLSYELPALRCRNPRWLTVQHIKLRPQTARQTDPLNQLDPDFRGKSLSSFIEGFVVSFVDRYQPLLKKSVDRCFFPDRKSWDTSTCSNYIDMLENRLFMLPSAYPRQASQSVPPLLLLMSWVSRLKSGRLTCNFSDELLLLQLGMVVTI